MDEHLVIAAQAGDEAAFAAITEASYVRFRSVAYRILRDPQLAEDATQQALVAIWRKLPRLREPAKFDAWSYRFVVHACYAEVRSTKRSLPDLASHSVPVAADDLGAVDDRDQIERAFQRLSVDQRAVVVLHHYLDMPIHQVADALGIPYGTAQSRLDRALKKLRLALHADDPTLQPAPQEVAR